MLLRQIYTSSLVKLNWHLFQLSVYGAENDFFNSFNFTVLFYFVSFSFSFLFTRINPKYFHKVLFPFLKSFKYYILFFGTNFNLTSISTSGYQLIYK